MFSVVCLLLAVADEPRVLKYSFKPGHEVKYINTQTRTNSVKKASRKLEVSLKQESANLWKVISVSTNGEAEVGQTITRLRITQKGGPAGVQVIDSNLNDNPAAVQALFDDLTKSEIRFKIRPNGEVAGLTLSDTLKERLKPKKEGDASFMTEEGVARSIKGSIFILPTKPLKPGDGWDLDPNRYQESGHWVVMRTRITYDGPIDQDGKKLLKFTRSAAYDVTTPKDGDASEVAIKRQAAEGIVLLDAVTCQLVESNMAESLLTESGSGAQKLETETTINTTIRIKEPTNREAPKEKAEPPTP